MIRFICREDDIGAAANVGGPVQSYHKTFTDSAECERWINEKVEWNIRTIIGCEVVPDADPALGEVEREG